MTNSACVCGWIIQVMDNTVVTNHLESQTQGFFTTLSLEHNHKCFLSHAPAILESSSLSLPLFCVQMLWKVCSLSSETVDEQQLAQQHQMESVYVCTYNMYTSWEESNLMIIMWYYNIWRTFLSTYCSYNACCTHVLVTTWFCMPYLASSMQSHIVTKL